MIVRVVEVTRLGGWRLRLRFDDDVCGELDLREVVPFEGVFARLNDPAEFDRVEIDREWGTLRWGQDLDIAPESLYLRIAGRDPLRPAA